VNSRPEGGWWSNNWKWAAPTGCLLMVVLVGAFVAAIFVFVFSMMKSNDAYQHAIDVARHNPQLTAALGEPITEGMFVSGHFEESGGAGEAQFSIPLSGPKGSATVYVEARKTAGRWNYSAMQAELDATHEHIDLLEAPAPEPAPGQ
jgi:hypothetical protein